VFWPEEDAVTTVAEANTVNAGTLKFEESYYVKMERKTYSGQMAILDKYN